MMKKAI